MNKFFKILLVMITAVFITGCDTNKKENNDSIKVKEEYESLNNTIREKDGKTITTISLSDLNPYVYTDATNIEKMIQEKKSFILYLGFADCPWCRNSITVLEKAAKSTGIKEVYYFNLKDENKEDVRNKITIENEKIVIENKGSDDYNKLLKLFNDKLDDYEGLNNSTYKRIYAPTVLFIKDGEVIGKHVGTVDSQKDPYILLDNGQEKELKNIYETYIHTMLDDLCDEKC